VGNTFVLTVQAQGTDKVLRRMQRLAQQGKSLRKPMGQAGLIMLKGVDENFQEEGRPRWKPRAPLTMAAIRGEAMVRASQTKRYGNAKRFNTRANILTSAASKAGSRRILDGEIRQSMVLKVESTRAIVGSAHPGARIHQRGGVIRPKVAKALVIPVGDRRLQLRQVTIPARPFLSIGSQDEEKILWVFRDWLSEEGVGW
jgi:phage gpG-like protein